MVLINNIPLFTVLVPLICWVSYQLGVSTLLWVGLSVHSPDNVDFGKIFKVFIKISDKANRLLQIWMNLNEITKYDLIDCLIFHLIVVNVLKWLIFLIAKVIKLI